SAAQESRLVGRGADRPPCCGPGDPRVLGPGGDTLVQRGFWKPVLGYVQTPGRQQLTLDRRDGCLQVSRVPIGGDADVDHDPRLVGAPWAPLVHRLTPALVRRLPHVAGPWA